MSDKEFLLKEYDAARTRIENEITQINQNEIIYVTFWLALHASLYQFEIVSKYSMITIGALTFLIAFYGYIRYSTHRRVIILHENYIKFVIEYVMYNQSYEDNIDRTHGLVAYYDKHKSDNLDNKTSSGHLKTVRYAIWFLLAAVSMIYTLIATLRPEWIINILPPRRA